VATKRNKNKRAPVEVLLAIYGRISEADYDETGTVDQVEHVTREAPTFPRLLAQGMPVRITGTYMDNDLSAADVWAVRPDFERLILDVQNGIVNTVAVREFDRLYRQPLDFHRLQNELEKAGGLFFFGLKPGEWMDFATGEGRMMAGILGEVNAEYVRGIAKKIRDKHRYLLEKGEFSGGTRRFGFTVSMRGREEAEYALVRDAVRRILAGTANTSSITTEWQEAGVPTASSDRWLAGPLRARINEEPRDDDPEIIRVVRNLAASGITMKHIVQQLNADGVPCNLKTKWQATTLNRILTGDHAKGYRVDDGKLVKAVWAPYALVTEAESDALRAIINDPDHINVGNDTRAKYAFTGKCRCGRCASTLYTRVSNGRRTWTCVKKTGGCARLARVADTMESSVLAELFSRYANPEWVNGLVQAQASGDDVDVAELATELRLIESRLTQTESDYRTPEEPEDALSVQDYRIIKKRLMTQKSDVNRRIREATSRRGHAFDLDLVQSGRIWQAWDNLTLAEQRMAVALAIKYVEVKPLGRGAQATATNSYEIIWAV
jgi:DNA invertase Pin-like site-specific DNA recombinase